MTNPDFDPKKVEWQMDAYKASENMKKLYGKSASIHCMYNAMQYDRGTPQYKYWMFVAVLLED